MNPLFGQKIASFSDHSSKVFAQQQTAAENTAKRKREIELHVQQGGTVTRDETDSYFEWKDSEGALHREGGPAIESDTPGQEEWYVHGKLHREDGPAVVFPSIPVRLLDHTRYSKPVEQYWLDGLKTSKELHARQRS